VSGGTEIEQVFHDERSRVLAALIGYFRDFELAEDALQDAFISALEHWPQDGMPANPAAWLTTAARRRALDRIRKNKPITGNDDDLERMPAQPTQDTDVDAHPFPDERLKLIFTCCHPALAEEAQVALTLRSLGGLTTEEIAKAFLVPAPTMAQRLVRAQRKIRGAGIPFEVPASHQIGARAAAVMAVMYLIFNEGYDASSGSDLVRDDLCDEAIQLARMFVALIEAEPADAPIQLFKPEAMGLLALMLLHHARRDARTDEAHQLVLLGAQDRARWRKDEIREGVTVLEAALRLGRVGPHQLQAAIAAVHAEAERPEHTDWQEIAALYERLAQMTPSPVVQLNQAVAVAMADGPLAGLMLLDQMKLEAALDGYYLFHSTRADLLRRLDERASARAEYERALALCHNEAEQAFLRQRLSEMTSDA
jgi:RNA polymerase sigma-70 factor (ECF subfamily)